MTRDEVLAMAEQAGIHRRSHPEGTKEMWCWEDAIERFHALAVAPYKEDAERWRMAKSLAVVRKSGRKLYKTDDPIPSYRLLKNADFGVVKPEINEEYEVCLFACIGETSIPEMDAMMDNAIDRARSAK